MGDAQGDPNEKPQWVEVNGFRLMKYEVTNRQFRAFVDTTGHVTDAERSGAGFVWTGRWRLVDGADWRHPRGRHSKIAGMDEHPVVQVSALDARAYCAHVGLRLPSEIEWEYAARGSDARRYPWGDTPPEQSNAERLRANFGTTQCCAADASDGYLHTAPVGGFHAGVGPFGAHDQAGNVWEWTASTFPGEPQKIVLRGGGWGNNPYCLRTAYRHGNRPETALDMVGMRCASDL